MGGQACIFYGAAEFSRDLDLLILADDHNLARLRLALDELAAEPIAVPALDEQVLRRGHAVHFRCRREDVAGLRIDIMSHLRGAGEFEEMWNRRASIEVAGETIDLMALEDLVRAKKTQRDKDWPMIRRLVEQSYFSAGEDERRVEFWLRELRTPELLVSVARDNPEAANRVAEARPAVRAALSGNIDETGRLLADEEHEERSRDRAYWEPLKREMEQFRRLRRSEC